MVDQQLEQGPIYGENDTTQATDQKGKILHRETDTDREIQSERKTDRETDRDRQRKRDNERAREIQNL